MEQTMLQNGLVKNVDLDFFRCIYRRCIYFILVVPKKKYFFQRLGKRIAVFPQEVGWATQVRHILKPTIHVIRRI